jgi:hypothetical protein
MSHNGRMAFAPTRSFEGARLLAASQSATGSTAALAAVRRGFAIVVLALAAGLPALAQKSASPNANADLPAGPMQAKATSACMECHEARIILQQRISKAAWTKEVDKMVKWGAVVDPADRDALIDYLSGNFGPDAPAFDPPQTARGNNLGKKK